ncbi:hypothetical protein BD408DRAFT_418078 [Parasitella parasitica]|nr:hypothetical protein BD408DRAFT_418078 [Parasitella parasitica]
METRFLQPLYNLVNTTHTVITHTFAFSKYIFLKELSANSNFNLNEFVRKEFFVKVFLSLIAQNTTRRSVKLKDTTAEYRKFIAKYQLGRRTVAN